MDTPTHKILDILEHLWPYVSGIVITMIATIRLWWYDRKETRTRLNDNAVAIKLIVANMATKEDLHECRNEVREEDEANLEKIYERIDAHAQANADQHHDLMQQIIRLHSGGSHDN